LTKGKRWDTKKEQKLKDLVAAKKPVSLIADVLGKTEDSVRSKMNRLGLAIEKEEAQNNSMSSSTLELPEELPTVETVLKMAAAAMKQLEKAKSKTEIMRLRAIIQAASVYQIKLAEYLDYRGIEAKLIELDEKYEKLVQEKRQNIKT
jgi:Xaa-Pro aminopeptidase